jgi:hypothetical protein
MEAALLLNAELGKQLTRRHLLTHNLNILVLLILLWSIYFKLRLGLDLLSNGSGNKLLSKLNLVWAINLAYNILTGDLREHRTVELVVLYLTIWQLNLRKDLGTAVLFN